MIRAVLYHRRVFPPRGNGGGGRGMRDGKAPDILSRDHQNLNISGKPPETAPPVIAVVNKKDHQTITTPRSQAVPLLSESLAPPSTARIDRNISNLLRVEAALQQARSAIRNARKNNPTDDIDYIPAGPIYRNALSFHRSYLEMEKKLKVFVYEEGEQPIFHNGPCGSIYSIEGYFMSKIEGTGFRTRNPEDAHVFFLPFSVASIVHFIYEKNISDQWRPMKQTVRDYVDLLAVKYPYWNRSSGFDHFMLACHDWGPELSKSVPELFKNSIRALCNANKSEGFQPWKDVSIPEINLQGGDDMTGMLGGPAPSERPILVFFAGGVHGPIRPILLDHWEDKDPDVQVHKYLPKNMSYHSMMRQSKYCICPSGYEVASPRMVEALYMGCVPVLIKDHYVPPFDDVLSWKSFSVTIPTEDIPNMKKILQAIPMKKYARLHKRGVQARRHFEVNLVPQRYDVFHMTLHSIWLRRLNIRLLER
ncbi:putative glycosyltransferase-like [Dorcoceras hygrometricum]|uniref:Putative glycosyltransferase-like n=1 Tax=Dorcoceras hygrometricum TaxID=472368 RepID=A0A2Z7B3V1_9LAMI|nr:putative glycosyltransferase-like [Dorcoceras hygrometricum]